MTIASIVVVDGFDTGYLGSRVRDRLASHECAFVNACFVHYFVTIPTWAGPVSRDEGDIA